MMTAFFCDFSFLNFISIYLLHDADFSSKNVSASVVIIAFPLVIMLCSYNLN